jgi:hypothetical protein
MTVDSARKKREQFALARRILRDGIETMPCSFCQKNGKTCVVSSESSRCSECARLGKKCDVEMPSTGSWEALERAEEKLEVEERRAREEERIARERYREAMAEAEGRLDRLARQRKFLKKRGAEMLRRGLRSMDELEEAEAREAAEREKGASPVRLPMPPSAGDPPEVPLVEQVLPDFGDAAFWEDLGFVGGSWQAAPGTGG